MYGIRTPDSDAMLAAGPDLDSGLAPIVGEALDRRLLAKGRRQRFVDGDPAVDGFLDQIVFVEFSAVLHRRLSRVLPTKTVVVVVDLDRP